MQLAPHAAAILKESSYLLSGETYEEMLQRIVDAVAKDKEQADRFSWLLQSGYLLPNSPCMMNAGTELNQLMACFVLPIEDSIDGIFKSLHDMAKIQKSGGGCGFIASRLRPKGDLVATTGGESSGVVSFLSIFNKVAEEIKQGGKRRGANLAALRVDHPEIFDFIRCKQDTDKMTNFNLSVGITDAFMEAIDDDESWDLINPHTKEATTVRAKEVWDAIVDCAWKTGEPGVLFLDRINKDNPTPHLGEIETVNPCGETNLLPYEACVLGGINIYEVFKDGVNNWELLGKVVEIAVEFLDRMIDVSSYPIPEIERMVKRTRKIGLGITGCGSMLFKIGIPYNSPKALKFVEYIWSFVNEQAVLASQGLAAKYGPYPEFEQSIHKDQTPRRNAAITTIAPEGTRSLIADVTSGIEPAFGLVYRRIILGKEYRIIDKVFEDELKKRRLYSEEILDKVEANRGSVQGLKEIPKDMQEVFLVAHDLSPRDHINMQAAFQKHTEQSISKTINLPNNATKKDVEDALRYAHSLGCKGVTVYRDGSRKGQILSAGKHTPSERPKILDGQTHKFVTGCGSLYVTVNKDLVGEPHELFVAHSQKQGCVSALLNSLARVTSISLRSGVDPAVVSEAMRGQVCGECENITSCADAIGQALSQPQVCTLGGGCQTCG